MRRRTAALATAVALAAGLAGGLAGSPAVHAATSPEARRAICVSARHPRLAARMARNITAAIHGRHSAVGLAVADPGLGLACRLDRASHFYAASVIKVTIIAALLRKIGAGRG